MSAVLRTDSGGGKNDNWRQVRKLSQHCKQVLTGGLAVPRDQGYDSLRGENLKAKNSIFVNLEKKLPEVLE